MITCTIDGVTLQVREGTTILEAARENGIEIPTLCYLKEVSNIGSCRLCMVEAQGYDRLLPSCRTAVEEGMVLRTNTEKLEGYRRSMLQLILANHRMECVDCPANGDCALQQLCGRYKVGVSP